MSKKNLYDGLVTLLNTVVAQRAAPLNGSTEMRFKTVRMWRNDLARESTEIPFLCPACLIEFMPSNYQEVGKGGQVQSYEMTVRLHVIFESYKDEDTDIFALVDGVYSKVQTKQFGNFGKLKRRNEEQDFDHPNVQDYIQDYDAGTVVDYGAVAITTTPLDDIATPGEII